MIEERQRSVVMTGLMARHMSTGGNPTVKASSACRYSSYPSVSCGGCSNGKNVIATQHDRDQRRVPAMPRERHLPYLYLASDWQWSR